MTEPRRSTRTRTVPASYTPVTKRARKRKYAAVNEDTYFVDKIVAERRIKGVVQYKVRWWAYGEEDDTWEVEENFDTREVLEEWKSQQRREAELERNVETTKYTAQEDDLISDEVMRAQKVEEKGEKKDEEICVILAGEEGIERGHEEEDRKYAEDVDENPSWSASHEEDKKEGPVYDQKEGSKDVEEDGEMEYAKDSISDEEEVKNDKLPKNLEDDLEAKSFEEEPGYSEDSSLDEDVEVKSKHDMRPINPKEDQEAYSFEKEAEYLEDSCNDEEERVKSSHDMQPDRVEEDSEELCFEEDDEVYFVENDHEQQFEESRCVCQRGFGGSESEEPLPSLGDFVAESNNIIFINAKQIRNMNVNEMQLQCTVCSELPPIKEENVDRVLCHLEVGNRCCFVIKLKYDEEELFVIEENIFKADCPTHYDDFMSISSDYDDTMIILAQEIQRWKIYLEKDDSDFYRLCCEGKMPDRMNTSLPTYTNQRKALQKWFDCENQLAIAEYLQSTVDYSTLYEYTLDFYNHRDPAFQNICLTFFESRYDKYVASILDED